jgi:hypothetical protein
VEIDGPRRKIPLGGRGTNWQLLWVGGLAPVITNARPDGFASTNHGLPAIARMNTSSAVSSTNSAVSSPQQLAQPNFPSSSEN